MTQRHIEILNELDRKGAKHYCLLPGRNIVGQISALVNGKRMDVAITKTQFGYYAAVSYDGDIYSKWARTPSDAVMALGYYMKEKVR
jgi:hypothetical protein